MLIRHATVADAEALRAIYNHEVENTTHTFDLVPRSLSQQRDWIRDREGALGVIVADLDGAVAGFASLSPYRDRPAYNTSVEDSIYVSRHHRGLGIGKSLLEELISLAQSRGVHTILAHIAGGHEPSIALHRACGFEITGTQREVGRKLGRWLDVVVMQRMLG